MSDYVDAEQGRLRYVRALEQHILELEAALIKVHEEVEKENGSIPARVILEIVKPAMEGVTHAGEKIRQYQEPESLRSTEGSGEVENNRSEDI